MTLAYIPGSPHQGLWRLKCQEENSFYSLGLAGGSEQRRIVLGLTDIHPKKKHAVQLQNKKYWGFENCGDAVTDKNKRREEKRNK